jgi:polar amino acid transport system substrate-binding protein
MGRSRTIVAAVALLAAGCTSLPRDPKGTVDRVRGGTLRVGLIEAPPWVVRTGGEPAGAEVELVRRLAAELDAEPQWIWGGSQPHLEALERFELDLVAGGLTDDTPWAKRVGLTGPYFDERIVVGVPAGMSLGDVKGTPVEVRAGDVAAAYLRKKGAVLVPVPAVGHSVNPVAAPEWDLGRLGRTPTGIELLTRKHVLAVPPGENGWIARLDQFLDSRRDQVRGLLQQEAARP